MDDKDVGANAVVLHVLPMATAAARAAVVDRENFMVLFVQQRSTVFVRDVMSVLQRNRVLTMFIPSSFTYCSGFSDKDKIFSVVTQVRGAIVT